MSYHHHIRGAIEIVPPLPWGKIRDSSHLPPLARSTGKELKFVITVEQIDTDQGILTKKTAAAVVDAWPGENRARTLIDELQTLVDQHPDHQFIGMLELFGEDNTDMWRVKVRGRAVVRIEPQITWPDDNEEPAA
jgi:hypothetical protein